MIKIECYACSSSGSYKDYKVYLLFSILKIEYEYMETVYFLGAFTTTTCRS
jgi:hypothetical protein